MHHYYYYNKQYILDEGRVPLWSSSSVLDHRSLPPCLNLRVGISEGCFIFDFASLPLEVAQPI